jgi:hypothetical protein
VVALWTNLLAAGVECLAPERSDLPISLVAIPERRLHAYRFKEYCCCLFLVPYT